MEEEEKIMSLFTAVHGNIAGTYYTEIAYNEEYDVDAVRVMKNGSMCWQATKLDLLFDYITTILLEQ